MVLWFTTTGWMMWNWLAGILLTGAAIVLYDGNPGGDVLWDLAADTGTTVFGTSAAFITAAMRAGTEPRAGRDLAIRAVGSTGSPLSVDGFRWVQQALGARTWLFSTSGGTDVCTSFLGGVPTLPVHLGEIQAPLLGVAVESWDEAGAPVPVGEVGELVVTRPMPSMPVGFWGDDDGARLREAYFDTYPGVWRHGDWLERTPSGGAVIHGRSDATINRGGVRMGTAEFLRRPRRAARSSPTRSSSTCRCSRRRARSGSSWRSRRAQPTPRAPRGAAGRRSRRRSAAPAPRGTCPIASPWCRRSRARSRASSSRCR